MKAEPSRATRAVSALVLVMAAAGVTITSANAATFAVTRFDDPPPDVCDADCSLREAVIAANAAPGADTIELPAGSYSLTIGRTTETTEATDGAQGDLDVTDTLNVQGIGGAATIDAGARFIAGAEDVTTTETGIQARGIHTIAQLTLGNVVVQGGSEEQGSGIFVRGGALFMTGGAVVDNGGENGGWGGGISVVNGQVITLGTTIARNVASRGFGGGLYSLSSTTVVSGGSIEDNVAYGCCGGGIYNSSNNAPAPLGRMTLNGVVVSGNEALDGAGGGIYTESGDDGGATELTIRDSSIDANVASDGCCGGGLYVTADAVVTIWDTGFTGNSAAYCCGGAIHNEGTLTFRRGAIVMSSVPGCCGGGVYSTGSSADTTLQHVTLSSNSAVDDPQQPSLPSGGGIHAGPGGRLHLSHVTVADNRRTVGGAGIHVGTTTAATVKGSIVARNGWGSVECAGPIVSLGYNISSDDSCGFTHATDRQNTDPRLTSLTGTGAGRAHELLPDSPAIDVVPILECPQPTNDQRKTPRPQDHAGAPGAGCDVGAIEMLGTTPTPTPPQTPTPTPAATATPTPTPVPTITPTPAPTATPTPSPGATPTPTPPATPTPSVTASPTATPTPTPSPEPIDPRCDDPGVICGTDGSERITGTDEGELIICGDGDDEVDARGGDDTIECGDEDETGDKDVDAGSGDDVVTCDGTGNDLVLGGAGDDSVACGRGDDRIRGGDGNDRLRSTTGRDSVTGGRGRDRIASGPGNDSVRGGTGRDRLRGGGGRDRVRGGANGDLVDGGSGPRDLCSGGAGRNTLRGCERLV